jgi:isoquinoline 1-oxidoreductase alpha subunit
MQTKDITLPYENVAVQCGFLALYSVANQHSGRLDYKLARHAFHNKQYPGPAATLIEEAQRMSTKFMLNGKAVKVNAEPDTPLLWVIRDELGYTGTKFGCGAGLCGACTVHVDGKPLRSCQTAVSQVEGRKITTIEAMAASPIGKKVQAAWIELDVPQCGYCQSGQIMSAVALLSTNPKPTDADIDAAMAGNICRCGTYPRIRAAIHAAAGTKGAQS